MNKTDLYDIRDIDSGDMNFILATWLRNLYYGNPVFGEIPKDVFMANYHRILENHLAGPTTQVKIACLKDDRDVILGYSVFRAAEEQSVLDYVFVKQAWRKIGIGRSLVPANVFAVTHLTAQGLAMLKTKLPKAHYNPFLL